MAESHQAEPADRPDSGEDVVESVDRTTDLNAEVITAAIINGTE